MSSPASTSLSRKLFGPVLVGAFCASLTILLVLLIRSSSHANLSLQLDAGAKQKTALNAELAGLNERIGALTQERDNLHAQTEELLQQKKVALDVIGQADAAAQTLTRLRADIAAAGEDSKRQQASMAAVLEQIRAAIGVAEDDAKKQKTGLSTGLAQLQQEQVSTERAVSEQKRVAREATDLVAAKEKEAVAAIEKLGSLKLQLNQLESQIADRDNRLRAINDRLVEREQALAKRAGEVSGLETTASGISEEIAKQKGELLMLNQQIASLKKIKVELSENERLRAEKAALSARIAVLQDDAGTLAATLKTGEKLRRDLESELAELKAEIANLRQRRTSLENSGK